MIDFYRDPSPTSIGDFGRTVRQQQIISQLKSKLATPNTIGKASELVQDLNGAVQTNLQVNDVIELANLARNIDGNSVQHLTLGPPDYAVPSTDGGRQGNYLPVCSNITPALQQMFNLAYPKCIPQGTGNTNSFARTAPSTTINVPTTINTAIASEPKQASPSKSTTKNHLQMDSTGDSLDAGAHGLLDILFATTCESFDALQI